jgi:hypothetical protein
LFLPVAACADDKCGSGSSSLPEILARGVNKLSGPFSVEELEKKNVRGSPNRLSVTIRLSNEAWQKMKATMKAGDQIYFLDHRDGGRYRDTSYVLVRDGCVVFRLLDSIT